MAERSLPPEAWCRVIGALELGLNTAVAESTGKPPALGAFGGLPRLPVDVVVGAGVPVGVADVSLQAYKLDLEGRFSSLHPTFHTSYLKPHQPGGSSGAPPEPVELDGQLEYEVEAIRLTGSEAEG